MGYIDIKIQKFTEDEQMDQLRRRLEETESAMERLMSQMGSVTDKLTAAKITEVLTQAQTQAKILKVRVWPKPSPRKTKPINIIVLVMLYCNVLVDINISKHRVSVIVKFGIYH